MFGFEVLERGAKDGIVQIGAHLYGSGPDSFGAGFVDEGVNNFLFR